MKSAFKHHFIIREILMKDWDPIGVAGVKGAEDEYDSYIMPIWSLLRRDCGSKDISKYLLETAHEKMGLTGFTESDFDVPTNKLMELQKEIKSIPIEDFQK